VAKEERKLHAVRLQGAALRDSLQSLRIRSRFKIINLVVDDITNDQINWRHVERMLQNRIPKIACSQRNRHWKTSV
jgi:hypothetical protein